jgi:hypothetical protein
MRSTSYEAQIPSRSTGYETLIENIPGGKVNILGGHSIGHSKQKSVNVHVSFSEIELWILSPP